MKKIKACVVGLGQIGFTYEFEESREHPATHFFGYLQKEQFEISCVVDCDAGKEVRIKKYASEAGFYPSLKEAVEAKALEHIDIVSICTPPALHLEQIRFLLENTGVKVIFCEKPLVRSREEYWELQELLEGKEVVIVPNISRRWNRGMRKVGEEIASGRYGELKKINIRYTRGIYNTGAHLFDLLKMWTKSRIESVQTVGKTRTSAEPEPSFSFAFEMENKVTGYAEAMDDDAYYLFEIDLYLSKGKIEMRNSGDDVFYYSVGKHHLFDGFLELVKERQDNHLLSDSCMKNAMDNLCKKFLEDEATACCLEDAVWPIYIAEALIESYNTKKEAKVNYE
ncbi:MAG: Gfo/Idh/MocA family oxidoreductase [Lachnospiraceae bacterium]|nr:Gfo/Idh/MocA family oxidoreductase [Lachnospiraceae bacterium]